MSKFYSLLNYGCQMNESDGEHYSGQLQELGYQYVADFHKADFILVNTCCVRESAEKRIAGKIGELKAVKVANPQVIIAVAGCMAQKEGDKLLQKYPQIDLVLGTSYVDDFKNILANYRRRAAFLDLTVRPKEFEGTKVRKSSFHAWIPIMYGCNNFCTYCIVPYVRGRERSRKKENILAEVRQGVSQGYKEFTLLGQNVDSYGKEFGVPDAFADLLLAVDAIPGVERLHYMTSHPRDISDAVIGAVAKGRHISEHFHLPVQSGSNEILRRMNRGYTREHYLELIRKIRLAVPQAVITTDIIVGFPGETEEDFQGTLDLVQEVGFDSAFTFIYSKRSGTPAAKMENQIPLDVKKQRLQRLMDLENINSLACNEKMVGREYSVFAEGPTKNRDIWSGRTSGNKLVLWPVEGRAYKQGDEVQVLVEKAQTWLVKGRAKQ
ncbi:MAG: tRNA (N6-isopentenyl adenosine(37)-C2)-methylthiotransferase MiaB [Acidaminococcaceae bacterium]|nr:tRNA (N6-isopentenyl adenosine(37)-C2)-methylthiotransferase MiaB [Acidaminococcaceae bacterium]